MRGEDYIFQAALLYLYVDNEGLLGMVLRGGRDSSCCSTSILSNKSVESPYHGIGGREWSELAL